MEKVGDLVERVELDFADAVQEFIDPRHRASDGEREILLLLILGAEKGTDILAERMDRFQLARAMRHRGVLYIHIYCRDKWVQFDP